MNRHLWLASALLILGVLVLAARPASAQNYPPSKPSVGVSDTTVTQGGTTTVSGHNWRAGSAVALALLQGGCSGASIQSLGSASVNASGEFSKTVTLDVSPGSYGIRVTGRNTAGEQAMQCVSVQVLGKTVGSGVALTGANLLFGIMLMIALAVIGVIALVAGRLRADQDAGSR